MTSSQDPNVPSTVRRTLSSGVTTTSDDLSDAWTLWAEKELSADERSSKAPGDGVDVPNRSSSAVEADPPTPRGQLPQREARQVDSERERSRTASSEDLLEERAAATSSSRVGAAGVAGAAGLAAAVSTKADAGTRVLDDATSTVDDKVESAPPTVRVTDLDKQALPDSNVATGAVPLSTATTDDAVAERPVADRQMVGDQAGQARFERVDSVEADEDSSPRIGWLILAALICAGLVGALMWFGLPGSSEDDPTSDSGTTSDVTSPTQSTAPAFTGTTAVTGAGGVGAGAAGAGADAGTGTGAATIGAAGTLTLNTTAVAFGMGETSKGIVVRNMGSAAVDWSATGPTNTVTLTPASGTLEPGAIAVVQIGRGIGATLGQTAQVQISAGPGAAPQVVTVTF